jgi:hypothetical protein
VGMAGNWGRHVRVRRTSRRDRRRALWNAKWDEWVSLPISRARLSSQQMWVVQVVVADAAAAHNSA